MSYKDMNSSSYVYKKGHRKIEMTCQIAAQSGIKYAWVDTCSIDKSSSAEVTEAINSMFQWYKRSKICYVILEDLPASASIESLKNCRWLTRGWTLQELIAPYHIIFFDQDWNYRGSKADLAEQLSKITNIGTEILLHQCSLSTISVAQRMSWAALRETTRIEDIAYSLLGIFDVNMPLLYGEEGKAFRRLQEETIKSISDFSIFAWKLPSDQQQEDLAQRRKVCGVLAENINAFALCGSIITDPDYELTEFAITNLGVKTRVQVLTMTIKSERNLRYGYVLPLRCSSAEEDSLGVQLRKCGPDQFVREDPWNLIHCALDANTNAPRERYLFTQLPKTEMDPRPIMNMSSFISRIRSHVLQVKCEHGFIMSDAWNWGRWDGEDDLFFVSRNTSWDSSVIRFNMNVPGETLNLKCTFYAIRWSCLANSSFQYTLVEDQRFANSLSEIQSWLVIWNHVSLQVMQKLISYNIPKTSSIAIKCPTIQKTALISGVANIQENTNICRNKFWRVSFSYQLLDDEFVPEIRSTTWKFW